MSLHIILSATICVFVAGNRSNYLENILLVPTNKKKRSMQNKQPLSLKEYCCDICDSCQVFC